MSSVSVSYIHTCLFLFSFLVKNFPPLLFFNIAFHSLRLLFSLSLSAFFTSPLHLSTMLLSSLSDSHIPPCVFFFFLSLSNFPPSPFFQYSFPPSQIPIPPPIFFPFLINFLHASPFPSQIHSSIASHPYLPVFLISPYAHFHPFFPRIPRCRLHGDIWWRNFNKPVEIRPNKL